MVSPDESRQMIDLSRISSPGGLAAEFLFRSGVRPPMETLHLTDAELQAWTGVFYGGWCEAHPRAPESPVPVVSLDIASCFPLIAHCIGWWDIVCAENVERVDTTAVVRNLCGRMRSEPEVALDADVWRLLGCTIVEVSPHGERWPVGLEDEQRPDGRMEMTSFDSDGVQFDYTWPDALHAAINAARPLDIRKAVTLRPVGAQASIRPFVDLRAGLRIDLTGDPVLPIVGHRRRLREAGDRLLALELHVFVNALVYGNFCRFDPVRRKVDGTWVNRERPGPWICMPLASTVTAGSRLLLGILDRSVHDLGGVVLYRDTDSSFVPTTRAGGDPVFRGRCSPRSLSWSEVRSVIEAFSPLSPGPDWPVWNVKGIS
jgi:hypothetical protein